MKMDDSIMKVVLGISVSDDFSAIDDMTPEDVEIALKRIVELYLRDRNSSTLRELITLEKSGYNHLDHKIGYDGYRIMEGRKIYCEVKPRNIDSNSKRKHDGGGNYTDFSWKKLKRYRRDNPDILISGFSSGRLLFIVKVPFNTESLVERFEKQLKRKFPGGDREGLWLRSASFSYRHYKDGKPRKIYVYGERVKNSRSLFTREFFEFLVS